MDERERIPRLRVYRRIGGLEIRMGELIAGGEVYRRIGGLENTMPFSTCSVGVYRRIGGLEKGGSA